MTGDAVEITSSIGSYGRVEASTLTDGGQGDPVRLVAHPGRLDEDPYLELDLGWQLKTPDGAVFSALLTPALAGDLFHYTGQFDASLAVRNLYVSAVDFGVDDLGAWAGSRMYRGDDVYLLDFWPLDSLNTVGGGVWWENGRVDVAAHVGMNRLAALDWQFQQVEETTPGGVASTTVTTLDRQRMIGSLRGSLNVPVGRVTVHPKLYGELHRLPAGERSIDDGLTEALPADRGALLGGQVSLWGWADDSYVSVFYRHASGLAAVGELAVPDGGFALDGTVHAAVDDQVALAFNHEGGVWSVAAGSYVRAFTDADGNAVDVDDGWEWVAAVRPGVYPTEHLAIQAEVSHQALRPNGLNARTNDYDRPAATQLSLLPAVQLGRGTFSRPSVHLRYSLVLLNEDAVDWYAASDLRAAQRVQHRLGIGAEWWVNSQSYR